MLKLAGLFCILSGSVGLGLTYRRSLAEGLRQLRYMKWLLERFIGEIRYGKAALPECCRQVGGEAEEPYRSALCAVHRGMTEQNGSSFSEEWRGRMGEALAPLPLTRMEKELFLKVADCVGLADNQMQVRAMEYRRDMLEGAIKRREDDLGKKSRLAMSLSAMGGLLLAVILL